jgi:hypothetical protein
MAKRKTKPKPKAGVADNFRKASILSHAATLGTTSAAAEFGVDRKTVQRYKAELDSGKNPELSQLVAREREITADRSRSKIQKALDVLLDRTIELAPNMTADEAIHGVDKVGNLATARQVMQLDNNIRDDGKRVSAGQELPGHGGLGGSTEGDTGESEPPVH